MIVVADLSGAELFVAALVYNDQPFLTKFRSGQSPHPDTAKMLFRRPVAKNEEAYTFSKSFTFRWLYVLPGKVLDDTGGGLRLYTVGLSAEALGPMVARMDQAHPAILAGKQQRINTLMATGKVYDPFGAYRNLSWATKSWDRKLQEHAKQAALNFPIQSSVRWIINRAYCMADQMIMDAGWPQDKGLVVQEHDSLGIYCSECRVDEGARILKHAMEQPVPELGGERMVAEVKAGPTWGTVKPIEVPSVQAGNSEAA